MSKISLIAAMAKNRVIGSQGKMPWRIPGELQHFKAITMNKPVVMGRKTYESIGKPLSGRRNIVVSHQENLHIQGCEVVGSLEAAFELAQEAPEVMVIGGAQIYTQALTFASTLYLTVIDQAYEGDAFFPEWQSEDWQEVAREPHQNSGISFLYLTMQRV